MAASRNTRKAELPATTTLPQAAGAIDRAPPAPGGVSNNLHARKSASATEAQIAKIVARERPAYLARSGLTKYRGPLPAVVLSAESISPDVLLENRPAYVVFSVWNTRNMPLENVWVRASILPLHSLDPYPALFEFPIKQVDGNHVVSGAISFYLPRSDLNNVITLELCQNGPLPPGGEFPPLIVLATDELTFDVGARFTVSMESIIIRDTASHHNDTLLVAVNGVTDEAKSWSDSNSLGDQNNTEGRGGLPPGLLPVGPIDVLPNSTTTVYVNCLIANSGYTSDQQDLKTGLEVSSHVGSIIATTVMSILFPVGTGLWAGLSAAADELNKVIIDWILADCDTVVLNDGRVITTSDMYTYSFDPADRQEDPPIPAPWVIRERKKEGYKIADWLGGGCRDSDYQCSLSLHRQRSAEMFHNTGEDGIALAPGDEAAFFALGHDIAITEFSCDVGQVTEYGTYKAPPTIGDRKYDVVRWDVYKDTKRGRELAWSDFGVVLLS